MPEFAKAPEKKLINMPFTAMPSQINHGVVLFNQYCGPCHSDVGTGGGTIPDLGYSTEATHKIFKDILLKGLLVNNGMPNFSGRLNEADVEDIHHYILATAKQMIEQRKK